MNNPDVTTQADAGGQPAPSSNATVVNFQGQAHADGASEVVGIFDNYAALCSAAHELYHAGFKHWDVMRDSRQEGTRAALPATVLADDPAARRTDHVEIEFLHDTAGYMIGTFAVLLGIAAAWGSASSSDSMTRTLIVVIVFGGGGAIVGAVISAMMAHFSRASLAARAAKNGLILWARSKSTAHETAALTVMKKYYAHHIHVRAAHGD